MRSIASEKTVLGTMLREIGPMDIGEQQRTYRLDHQ
jgi:hypothetical protein